MEQAEIATHNQRLLPQRTHRVTGPSASMELLVSPTIIPDILPSHVDYTPSGVQAPHLTSTEHRHEPDERDHVESPSPEVSTKPSKKRKDVLRKRAQRADDSQHFTRICELLEIPLSPKKTLAYRSEYPCIRLSCY